jgi:hypothetical protein
MTVANIIEGYWKAVAKGIDAEDEKLTVLVRHGPSLGAGREAILRNLVERQTPAPFTVATGFAFYHEDPSRKPDPYYSRQCDLLVFDPTESRPLYTIDAFCVVPYIACKFVIEVKSSLNKKPFKELLAVSQSVAGLAIPTFGFAYTSGTFKNFLDLLASAVVDSATPKNSLTLLPECICVHKKNILAFRLPASEKHPPEQYMALHLGFKGAETSGAATGHFLTFYDEVLKGHDHRRINRPWWFNEFPLPPEAKAWIDCNGNITRGNLPGSPEHLRRD